MRQRGRRKDARVRAAAEEGFKRPVWGQRANGAKEKRIRVDVGRSPDRSGGTLNCIGQERKVGGGVKKELREDCQSIWETNLSTGGTNSGSGRTQAVKSGRMS